MSEIVTNPFIENRVSPTLLKLFIKAAASSVTGIGPNDAMYYAVRAFTELPNDPFAHAGLADPYTKQIDVNPLYVFQPDKAAADLPSITLGFAFVRDGTYYIHPLAEVLYGPTAFFRNPTSSAAANDLMKVMLHYVLPGLYWRTHYARQELPDTIELAHRMDATLHDIADLAMGKK